MSWQGPTYNLWNMGHITRVQAVAVLQEQLLEKLSEAKRIAEDIEDATATMRAVTRVKKVDSTRNWLKSVLYTIDLAKKRARQRCVTENADGE